MSFFIRMWYQQKRRSAWLFLPLSYLYLGIFKLRQAWLMRFAQWKSSVPLVVVGNLTVGGVGKTPLVIAIAKAAKQQGFCVGIVSRGYRAKIRTFPHDVLNEDSAEQVGDEPALIKKETGCPVVISPKRVEAVKYLLKHYPLDLIISDDGLQHAALGRHVEIVVIDGIRKFGNGLLLPAGPLREKITRLERVDLKVINTRVSHAKGSVHVISNPTSRGLSAGSRNLAASLDPVDSPATEEDVFQMQMQPIGFVSLKDGKLLPLDFFKNKPVSVVTGIGHPERFLACLKTLGLSFTSHIFPDHYPFEEKTFNRISGPIVMTEKDAVKCEKYAASDWFILKVEAVMDESFWQNLWSLVKEG